MIDQIIKTKKEEIEKLKADLSIEDLKKTVNPRAESKRFSRALDKKNRLALIGEIKKASPSAGILKDEFNPLKLAKTYQKAGLDALSVLAEKTHFKGDPEYIKMLKNVIDLPILQKDFLLDEYQIYHSVYIGADALLLIVNILDKQKIKEFLKLADTLNLELLIEVHNKQDLDKIADLAPSLIGINNRNLQTLKVDIQNTKRIIALLEDKKNKIIVSESGINKVKDIKYLKNLGVNALLIGEVFMKADDIDSKIKEFRKESYYES
jgi:indole-3-glycerol phosphate synthase